MTAPRPIRVTIDRLVLHGIAHADAAAVERALAAELQVRLAVPGTNDPAALGRSAGAGIAAALVPARRQSG